MRNELEHRPAIAYLTGLLIGITAILLPVNLLALPLAYVVYRSLKVRLGLTIAFLCGLAIHPPPVANLQTTGFHTVVATITRHPMPTAYGMTAEATIDGIPIVIYAEPNAHFEPGQTLRIKGVLAPPPHPDINGPVASLKAAEWQLLSEPPLAHRLANRWQANMETLLDRSLNLEERRFVMALCFGGHETLTPAERSDAASEGWLPLVSASGLQVLALVAMLELAGAMIPMPRVVLLAILTAVLCCYGIAAGFGAPTTRAVLVALLARWAYLVGREPDMLSAVAVSGLVILAIDSRAVYSLGFQLTMLTLAGVALFVTRVPFTNQSDRWRSALRAALRASLVVALVAMPLVAQWFHHVSAKGFLACFLVAGYVPLMVATAFVGPLLAAVSLPVGVGWVEVVVKPLTLGLHRFFDLLSPYDLAADVPAFSGYWLCLYFGLWTLTWRRFARPR